MPVASAAILSAARLARAGGGGPSRPVDQEKGAYGVFVMDPARRWFEVFRVKWRRLEHNNIGELRIAVMTLRHIARSRRNWSCRHLIFTDSMVMLGALAKGRSSSWPLLRLTPEAAVLQLVLDLRPYWRYIETDRNVADGPSRGYGVGHAPPSASARDLDLQQILRR